MRFFQFLHYVNLISFNIPEEGLSTPIPPPPTTLSWSLLERLSFQYVLIWIKEIFESGYNNKISGINIFFSYADGMLLNLSLRIIHLFLLDLPAFAFFLVNEKYKRIEIWLIWIVVRSIEFKASFFEILTIGDSKILMSVSLLDKKKTLKTWWTTDRVIVYHKRKFRF